MDEFGMTIALQFTPQTVFSMLGALVGSLISADVKRYGWRLTILFTIVASVVGGAMSEYLVNEKNIVQIWVLFSFTKYSLIAPPTTAATIINNTVNLIP